MYTVLQWYSCTAAITIIWAPVGDWVCLLCTCMPQNWQCWQLFRT